jgi:signal transduction histidine kinase
MRINLVPVRALQRTSENDSSPSSGKEEGYACALHEVSNALTVVLGWLDLAARADSKEEVARALDVAREHAHRGHVLARRAIGAEVLSRQSGRSARALAQFASVSVNPQAALKDVEIVVQAGAGTDVVLEGEAHLLQALTNLLLNAIAFSPELGKVKLTLERQDDSIRFVVEDEGPGVPVERAGTFTVAGARMWG